MCVWERDGNDNAYNDRMIMMLQVMMGVVEGLRS